jgi:predicted amidohydrolase YtcJ
MRADPGIVRVLLTIALAAATALLPGTLHAASGADDRTTLYTNATIYTVQPQRPRAEAMAVRNGRIIATGTAADVRRAAADDAAVVDLGGRTVLPGLIDAHGHMAGLGALGMGVIDLSAAQSFAQVVQRAGAAAREKEEDQWILGGRWDHESWPQRQLPRHEQLSEATPKNPVWLRRVDGHAGIANRRAMELAGITRESRNPPGGEILREDDGEPTGVLVDTAMQLIEAQIPPGTRGTGRELILRAQELCLAAGLTSVHDAGVSPADVAVYRQLADEGVLKLRIYAMVAGPHALRWFDRNEPIINYGPGPGGRLTVRSAKLYIDGAMGSRGAWLLEPYADRPAGPDGEPYTGLAVSDPDFIETVARHGAARGYQVNTHAIGDRGNREVLDAYERAFGELRPGRDHRYRIEHAQLLALQDIGRFAALGVIASMQPTHCTSDMRWVEDRVGLRRARGAYAWASLLRSGAIIAAGSDFPVESHNPFLGFHAAITRQTVDGRPEGGWMPQERMTREDILRAMTLDAAFAAFEEHDKGSLEPGKLADFIVLDRDVMVCDEREIPETRVLMTVVGGEVVFEAGLRER